MDLEESYRDSGVFVVKSQNGLATFLLVKFERVLVFKHGRLPFQELILVAKKLLLFFDKPGLLLNQVFLPLDQGFLIGDQFRQLHGWQPRVGWCGAAVAIVPVVEQTS